LVEELLERSGEIDVYVITGEGSDAHPHVATAAPKPPISRRHYVLTAGVVATCSTLSWSTQHFLGWPEANTVMIFLAGVALVATRYGRGPAIAASVCSAMLVEFFFLPPYVTFALSGTKYFITFAVMLGIGLLISALSARQRAQLRTSQEQEQRTAKLFRLTRQLSELTGTDFLLQTAGRQLIEFFGGEAAIYLRKSDGSLVVRLGQNTSIAANSINETVAQWVADHDQMAGANTDTLPNATALFVPLIGSQQTVGALGVRPADANLFRDPEQRRLLETCASLIALSIERDQSVLEAQQVQIQMQAEQLRNSLLSSVSHDLRTPLTGIAGTAASLSEQLLPVTNAHQQATLQSLVDESHRLVRLVENLLSVARSESGSIVLNRQWHVLEEIVGSAITRSRRELGDRTVHVEIPPDFPLIAVDGVLLEQVFVNLLENASHYVPSGSRIEILARAIGDRVEVVFADNGPGLPVGSDNQVFQKFFRGASATADGRRGVGLGLTICKGIVEAHGGKICARNRSTGGAEFTVLLPCRQQLAEAVRNQFHVPAHSH
jgi:two-component system sensor histidine kinase KdpD